MRKKNHTQLPLMDNGINHPHAEDYERISEILDSIPTINEMVLQDLTALAQEKSDKKEWKLPYTLPAQSGDCS